MRKIKDFMYGEDVELFARLFDISIRSTSANSEYASLNAFDGEDVVEAKIWGVDEQKKSILKNDEVYFIEGKLREYQGRPQLIISELRLATEEDNIDLTQYYEFAKLSEEELKEEIFGYINKISNPLLRGITKELITIYQDRFFTHPAAVVMHHNYHSGLAYHVYSMLKLSDGILNVYPFLNKDLLYSGIILHDLGKTFELSGPKGTEYTLEGNLIGHITLCVNEIYRIASQMGVEKSDEVLTLMHLVLSHHGELEYGSPKEPIVAEGVVIHFLDNLDARLATLEKELSRTKKGKFTDNLPIFDRKAFYNPNIK